MKKENEPVELTKEKSHIIVQIVEYIPDSIVSKTVIKKTTGNVTATSFDEGEVLEEKTAPYDIYVQIIDGSAEVTIEGKVFTLKLGDGIIIPCGKKHKFTAKEQFKMITTVIKSSFDDC